MSAIGSLPVFNALTGSLPCEGPRVLSDLLDFGATNEYDFDLTQQFQQGIFTTLQTMFVDNSGNGSVVTVKVNATGQTFTIPANSCGYYTLLMAAPPIFSMTSAGGVVIYIALMNFYVPPTVWKTV